MSGVVCWAVDGGIACECEFENGALGSGIFDSDLREGAWFVREKPAAVQRPNHRRRGFCVGAISGRAAGSASHPSNVLRTP